MKVQKLLSGLAVAGLALFSCQDDSKEATVEQLSPFAKKYIGMQWGNGTLNSMSNDNLSSKIANQSFNRLYNAASFAGGRAGEDKDTTIVEDPLNWVTCAKVTVVENEDQSTTTSYDYGDGCLEGNSETYQYLVYGKYSYTNRHTSEQDGDVFKDAFISNYISENYGGSYYWGGDTTTWSLNGYSNYSGESEYNQKTNNYNGQYTYDYNNTHIWEGSVYANEGRGKTSYTHEYYRVDERDDTYSQTENSYYRSTVLSPLVARWDCNPWLEQTDGIAYCIWMPTFTSGREFIRYKSEDGTEGSFVIDYGDGECDNIITIIENNVAVKLDLNKRSVMREINAH